MIIALRLPKAAMIRTSFPFIRSPSFVFRLTVAANRQVLPIRSAGVIDQTVAVGHVAGFPSACPGIRPGTSVVNMNDPAPRLTSAAVREKYGFPTDRIHYRPSSRGAETFNDTC